MSRGVPLLAGWSLAAVLVAGFAWMGFWQLGRMHEKQAMVDAVAATLAARDALPLAAAADATRASGFDWAAGSGHFTGSAAVLLDNQQRAGRTGVRAYRVFQPEAPGAVPLLVDLGWLPLRGDRAMPRVAAPAGRLALRGLLAPPPAAGVLEATPRALDDGTLLAIALDPAALRTALAQPRLATRVLRLDPALPMGHDRDLEVLANTLPPERHLGYAVQWFGLALAALVTALLLTLRRPRPRRHDEAAARNGNGNGKPPHDPGRTTP